VQVQSCGVCLAAGLHAWTTTLWWKPTARCTRRLCSDAAKRAVFTVMLVVARARVPFPAPPKEATALAAAGRGGSGARAAAAAAAADRVLPVSVSVPVHLPVRLPDELWYHALGMIKVWELGGREAVVGMPSTSS